MAASKYMEAGARREDRRPKRQTIIVVKPPKRGIYSFNGMPTTTLAEWKRLAKDRI